MQYALSPCICSTSSYHCYHYSAFLPLLHLLDHSFLLACACCNQPACSSGFHSTVALEFLPILLLTIALLVAVSKKCDISILLGLFHILEFCATIIQVDGLHQFQSSFLGFSLNADITTSYLSGI